MRLRQLLHSQIPTVSARNSDASVVLFVSYQFKEKAGAEEHALQGAVAGAFNVGQYPVLSLLGVAKSGCGTRDTSAA